MNKKQTFTLTARSVQDESTVRTSFVLLFQFSLVIAFFSSVSVFAVPQFAVLEGSTCISCHTNAQGGGLRTFRGWRYGYDKSLIKPERVGLGTLYEKDGKSSTLFDGRLTLGGDFRFQSARSHKSKESDRRYFPMQAALYSNFRANDYIVIDGSYNFGPKKFRGQQQWTASLVIQPRYSFTQFRIGFFQPSVGIRYDDHTMVLRQVAGADMTSLIPVNYAEYGAEFTFNRFDWLTLAAGVFGAKSLAENRVTDKFGTEMSLIEDRDNPSVLGRIELRRREFADVINAGAGASVLRNGDFMLTNVFGILGFYEKASLIAELALSDKENLRNTENVSLELSYVVLDALLVFARGEKGETNSKFSGLDIETYANQGVFGAEIFVLPYIVFRPEYRILDTERYRSTRYSFQLHIFR